MYTSFGIGRDAKYDLRAHSEEYKLRSLVISESRQTASAQLQLIGSDEDWREFAKMILREVEPAALAEKPAITSALAKKDVAA